MIFFFLPLHLKNIHILNKHLWARNILPCPFFNYLLFFHFKNVYLQLDLQNLVFWSRMSNNANDLISHRNCIYCVNFTSICTRFVSVFLSKWHSTHSKVYISHHAVRSSKIFALSMPKSTCYFKCWVICIQPWNVQTYLLWRYNFMQFHGQLYLPILYIWKMGRKRLWYDF